MGTLPTEMGNMTETWLVIVYTLPQLFNGFCILYDYFYIFCYECIILRWTVLIDQNISLLASLVTFSFQSAAVSV